MTYPSRNEVEKLDVYASHFVPKALRDINYFPVPIVACEAPAQFNIPSYVSRFFGSDLLNTTTSSFPGGSGPSNADVSFDNGQDALPGIGVRNLLVGALTPDVYLNHFQSALRHESIALQQACDNHSLFKVEISRNPYDPRPSIFTLYVPGLREQSLRIDVGDIVQLRQVYPYWNSDHSNALYNTDAQYDSVVWTISRREETISLRIDGLLYGTMLFNVRFTVQSWQLRALHGSVLSAQKALRNKGESTWLRSMLFPAEQDCTYQRTLNKRVFNLELNDHLLNYEQLRAIDTALSRNYGEMPFLISGPPGTGKTKTIVELVLQLIKQGPGVHLLVTAPSDSAADTIVQRLSKTLNTPWKLLRICSASRSFPEVPNTVLPYCFVEDGTFGLPPLGQFMKCQAVVTTCRDANILLQARLSNSDLFQFETKMMNMLHPEAEATPPQLHWAALLVDEAAQATEPEVLLAVNVIAPPPDHIDTTARPLFILAGDANQLGPRTASQTRAIQTSLFERLLNRSVYCNHPLARSRGVVRPLTQDMLPILRPAFMNLIRNYRSHPAILATPSSLFYYDTLEPEATDTNSLLSWPGWKGQLWPVLFAPNTANDEIEGDGGGWYNLTEARMACQYAASFIRSALLAPKDICIMSPFAAQVRILRRCAKTEIGMPSLNIGPLEAFQGLESSLVILCSTRTRNRFIDQDVARGLGVIFEPKRFNVALTRAKQGLIVIGNPTVLEQDSNWRAFLAFCRRNGLHEPLRDGIELPVDERSASRLERQLIERQNQEKDPVVGLISGMRKFGFAKDRDESFWESGLAAEASIKWQNRQIEGEDN